MILKTPILFLLVATGILMAQDVSVTGQVVDDDGLPVGSAKVELQGTNLMSLTNDSGMFSITGMANRIKEVKGVIPRSYATLNGNNLDYSISVPGLFAKVAIVTLTGKRICEVLIPNKIGKYHASIVDLFGSDISIGINLIQLQIGKENYSWLFSNIDNGLKSKIGNNRGISNSNNQETFKKSAASEITSVIQVSKIGYFLKQIQLSNLTGNLGKFPMTRNKPGSIPVEMKLNISTDSLFSNPIFVSASLDRLAPLDTGTDNFQILQSWVIDSSVIAGLTDSTNVSIRMDSSFYHPSKHSIPYIFGEINGDTSIVLISAPQDVDTVDLSIRVSFSVKKLREGGALLKRRGDGPPKPPEVKLKLDKWRTQSGENDQVRALANLHLTNNSWSINNRSAVVFVHGVFSDESIWDNAYLEQAVALGIDVFTIDYRTNYHISSNGYALQTQMRRNMVPKPFKDYESIIFVCHSMGGLVVRKAISEGEKAGDPWFSKTKKIIFYSTPHEGGDASWGKFDGEGRWLLQKFLVKIGKIAALPIFKAFQNSGFLDLYYGYMNESDWGDGVIDYVLKPRSKVPLSSTIRPYATVVLHDEVVSENSAFNRHHQDELNLKPFVYYKKGEVFSNENAVLQSDGSGLLHSSSYNSEYGHDLFWQWIGCPPTIIDIDNNVYTTVQIGTQCWTVENLKTTKYNDGSAIPNVTDHVQWAGLKTGAYSYYGNNTANKTKYGALYNWYAVGTGKLAPKGWHVPTDAEWDILQTYLIENGYNWDGSKPAGSPPYRYEYNKIAKSMAAQTDWRSIYSDMGSIATDLSKNNASEFSALPGGCRDGSDFYYLGSTGRWWSDTESGWSYAYYRDLDPAREGLFRDYTTEQWGFSVRLLRDLN